jgi:hypothetical protein
MGWLGVHRLHAGAGLLQVRAVALIPCRDWLRQPCASLTRDPGRAPPVSW